LFFFFPLDFFVVAWDVAIGSPQVVPENEGKPLCAGADADVNADADADAATDETAVRALEVLRASDAGLREGRAAWAATAAVVRSTAGGALAKAIEAVVRTLMRLRCPDDDEEDTPVYLEALVVLVKAVVLVRALMTLCVSSSSSPSPSPSSKSSSSPATDQARRAELAVEHPSSLLLSQCGTPADKSSSRGLAGGGGGSGLAMRTSVRRSQSQVICSYLPQQGNTP
jgi:hypothetical protein